MARRHVAEGEEHVARQEILIAKLDRDGHSKLAVQARALLCGAMKSEPDLWMTVGAPQPVSD